MDNIVQKARDFLKSGNFEEGLRLYSTLLHPSPEIEAEYGSAAAYSGDFDLADRIWEKLHERERRNAQALSWLAGEYGNWGLHTKSRAIGAEAASLEPRNLDLQINLAWVLTRGAKVQEARPVVNKCLELDPGNEAARYFSAHLDRREGKLAEAERQCRDLLATALRNPRVRMAVHAELAYILDQTERFEEAMAQLEQGKSFARQNFGDDSDRKSFLDHMEMVTRQVKSLPKNILQVWSGLFPPHARAEAASVTFLTGAARSGTTLLERVLDAHPAVTAGDELTVFENILRRIDFMTPEIPAQRINVLRQLYVKSMAVAIGSSGQDKLFLDKNPGKMYWLPGFLRVFPELRVLIGLRDPRDVMISLYFQDHPRTNHLTLKQLTEHYASVMDLWLAMREWEGLNWLETRYEDMVVDLQKEGRRVTEFLGLEWDENQARFYERNQEKPTMSNNYNDVSKPVYKRAAGRWRNYEKQLAPILKTLEPYCREFGYE